MGTMARSDRTASMARSAPGRWSTMLTESATRWGRRVRTSSASRSTGAPAPTKSTLQPRCSSVSATMRPPTWWNSSAAQETSAVRPVAWRARARGKTSESSSSVMAVARCSTATVTSPTSQRRPTSSSEAWNSSR